jgi:hypothetical protein
MSSTREVAPRIEANTRFGQARPARFAEHDFLGAVKRQPAAGIFTSLFHEPWWLNAVTGGNWQEVTLASDGKPIARLPFVMKRTLGMTGIAMPALTRTLGPQLPMAAASEHRAMIRELVEKLPRHDFFSQICDPAMRDGLGFYVLGYNSALSYTLRVPAGQAQARSWQNIRKSLRSKIRQAERGFSVHFDLGIDEFCHFHNRCVKANHHIIWTKTYERRIDDTKRRLYEACAQRDAIRVLGARDARGELRAAIVVVWGHGVMYNLLNARAPELENSGAAKLLIWEALKLAQVLNLTFDFDGFSRPEAATALTGFGGMIENRIAITKTTPLLQFAKAVMARVKLGM